MVKDLVVVGAGGFGREVLDVVDAINDASDSPVWNVVGVLDDSPTEANLALVADRDIAYLGQIGDFVGSAGSQAVYVIGIGSPLVRRRIAEAFDAAGRVPAILIHPAATLGWDVRIGPGSIICAGVRLTTNIGLGAHVHLNPNVTIGHDTTLGDFVSVNPAASISGDCTLEGQVLIGAGAVILNGLRVGESAVVGGSACVVKDVPAASTVKGVPAR